MQTTTFYRKPFPVQGIQVTAENLFDVATWCGGEVLVTQPKSAPSGSTGQKSYVKVPTMYPRNIKQTMAFPGDWVLATSTNNGSNSYKVYTNKAFKDTFDPADVQEDHNYGAVIGQSA